MPTSPYSYSNSLPKSQPIIFSSTLTTGKSSSESQVEILWILQFFFFFFCSEENFKTDSSVVTCAASETTCFSILFSTHSTPYRVISYSIFSWNDKYIMYNNAHCNMCIVTSKEISTVICARMSSSSRWDRGFKGWITCGFVQLLKSLWFRDPLVVVQLYKYCNMCLLKIWKAMLV